MQVNFTVKTEKITPHPFLKELAGVKDEAVTLKTPG